MDVDVNLNMNTTFDLDMVGSEGAEPEFEPPRRRQTPRSENCDVRNHRKTVRVLASAAPWRFNSRWPELELPDALRFNSLLPELALGDAHNGISASWAPPPP